MEDNEIVIRRFIADWSSLDPDLLVAYFTEDGVYHNMPLKPVAGHAALRALSPASCATGSKPTGKSSTSCRAATW